jgi:hypothetical protein
VHRIQLSADAPLVGAVSKWAADFPDQAPERFRRAISSVPDDLSEYDVVILGDCKATVVPQLTEFVTIRGKHIELCAELGLGKLSPDALPPRMARTIASDRGVELQAAHDGKFDHCASAQLCSSLAKSSATSSR